MDSTTRLHLIRHGEVNSRYHRIFGGRIDMDLSPEGHAQAAKLAKYLTPIHFDHFFCSPMMRAKQTAEPILLARPNTPVILKDLREVDFGDWTGLTWEEVRQKFGVSAFEWLHQLESNSIPGAESGAQFRERVDPALRGAIAASEGKTAAIVCHGGVIRMILSILLELPLPKMAGFEVDYASLSTVSIQGRKVEVDLLNFTPWRDLH